MAFYCIHAEYFMAFPACTYFSLQMCELTVAFTRIKACSLTVFCHDVERGGVLTTLIVFREVHAELTLSCSAATGCVCLHQLTEVFTENDDEMSFTFI